MKSQFSAWQGVYYLMLCACALFAQRAHAEWIYRDVLSVTGSFDHFAPHSDLVGSGPSHIEWGNPLPGSFTSTLQYNDYDAWPTLDQEWFWGGGQHVLPGQTFLAGSIIYRNGLAASESSPNTRTVDLDTYVFGSEFPLNGPLTMLDTWKI